MAYVGPGGSAAFGKRYKFPGGAPAQKAPAGGGSAPAGGSGATPAQAQNLKNSVQNTAVSLGNIYGQSHPGWTPPSAPEGVTVTPGSAGTPTPPVPPFMTGQDIINFGDAYKSKADQIGQADKDLGDIKAWAQTALYNIGRNYLQGTDNTQNDAAARGIFQSSIKDGSLADLAATKATMSSDVNTRVNNAQLFHDSAIQRVNDWFNNFQEGMNAIKVQNASAAGANSPPYVPGQEPSPTTFAPTPPAAPPPPAAKAQPNYTGPKYSLSQPGKPKYRLGGYA